MATTKQSAGARRVGTYAAAALILQLVCLAVWGVRYYCLNDRSSPMVGSDFAVFWAAARVALEHRAPAVFSAEWIQPIEATLRPFADFSPWPYPPTFLIVVIAFGLLPFTRALVLFGTLELACYAIVLAKLTRPLNGPLRVALAAFPGLIGAALTMQNAFVTVAAAGAALLLIESSPVLAGACIATLIIKPQFGVLFPLALACGRSWKALASAGLFVIAIVAISVAAFGATAWAAFFAFVPEFNRQVVEHGDTFWRGMPSVFAAARGAGWSVGLAYAAHAMFAIPAAVTVAWLWMRRTRFELRAAGLAAATLLVQPYYMYYDLLWLALPIAFLLRDARHVPLSRHETAVVALAWLAPAQAFMSAITGTMWPVAPAVLSAVLVVIVRRSTVTAVHRLPAPERYCTPQ